MRAHAPHNRLTLGTHLQSSKLTMPHREASSRVLAPLVAEVHRLFS
jgi:hypothetical protein